MPLTKPVPVDRGKAAPFHVLVVFVSCWSGQRSSRGRTHLFEMMGSLAGSHATGATRPRPSSLDRLRQKSVLPGPYSAESLVPCPRAEWEGVAMLSRFAGSDGTSCASPHSMADGRVETGRPASAADQAACGDLVRAAISSARRSISRRDSDSNGAFQSELGCSNTVEPECSMRGMK